MIRVGPVIVHEAIGILRRNLGGNDFSGSDPLIVGIEAVEGLTIDEAQQLIDIFNKLATGIQFGWQVYGKR